MKIRILSSGFSDLQQGREFHDMRQAGLGDYFYDSVFSDIDSLILYAGIHRKVYGYFRLLTQRFPYAVYYKISGVDIVVYRVLDCRRSPEKIQQELEK